jgi:hypothetical protein
MHALSECIHRFIDLCMQSMHESEKIIIVTSIDKSYFRKAYILYSTFFYNGRQLRFFKIDILHSNRSIGWSRCLHFFCIHLIAAIE